MQTLPFSHAQRLAAAQLTPADLHEIQQRRRPHNRLGFAYQLVFVRLANRFPVQQPLEIDEGLLTFVSLQLAIPTPLIQLYSQRQATLSAHQEQVRAYLGRRRFAEAEAQALASFLLGEASRLEQSGPLLSQAKRFLQEADILCPADDTLRRLVAEQRQQARVQIFGRISDSLSAPLRAQLDALLVPGDGQHLTPLHALKQPPGRPSPAAMLRLADKLTRIQATAILTLDLTWLNNNYQRSLTRYAQRCSADRLRKLRPEHRYAVLACFLWQLYRDTIDHMIDMHDKLLTGVYQRAQTELDAVHRQQRPLLRRALTVLQALAEAILDESIRDAELRQALFRRVEPERLVTQMTHVADWLNGSHSHVFHRVVQRFTYLRQFAPTFLQHLQLRREEGAATTVVEAIAFLQQLNQAHKRKLPDGAPVDFVPKALRPRVLKAGAVDKRAWECVLLTTIRDEIKAGNVYVHASKRFGRFADFFIPDVQWAAQRERFFQRAGLPTQAAAVPAFLRARLQQAYDRFLAQLPTNTYAKVDATGWQLAADAAEKLDGESASRLAALQDWLAAHLREIKLPELLIEVDNELHFTQHFQLPAQPHRREAEQVCAILATLMAHGCNIVKNGIECPQINGLRCPLFIAPNVPW